MENKTIAGFLFEILHLWKSGRKITITISCEQEKDSAKSEGKELSK